MPPGPASGARGLRRWGIEVALIEPASIHTDAIDKLETEADTALDAMGPDGRALYGDQLRTMVTTFGRSERHGSSPDVVARAVHHALTVREPRARYLVGKDSRRMALMARWVPHHALDRLRPGPSAYPADSDTTGRGCHAPALERLVT